MDWIRTASLVGICTFFGACGGAGGAPDGGGGGGDAGPSGIPVLGGGAHDRNVDARVVVDASGGLSTPRDLAFNPEAPGQLWIVNLDNSVVVVRNVSTEDQAADKRNSLGSDHFLSRPSSLAFGAPGRLATAQEQDEITQPTTPADFMGPVLWTSDLEIFDAGHGGHLDMLHNSPNGAGIAWDEGNAYWVFDGYHQSLTRYDFQEDHGPGGADHSDGVVRRYAEGQVGYVPDVPSHMEMDHEAGLLYVADTGNNRIAVLDPSDAMRGEAITPNYDGSRQHMMNGASLTTLVDGAMVDGLERPSGLALHDGLVFVSDNATSRVLAFDPMTGELIDWLDLSAVLADEGLMGIDLAENGDLVVVDAVDERVVRVSPQGE